MRKTSATISFRIDEDMLRLLDETRKPFGISRGEWARGVVIAHLMRHDQMAIVEQVADLRALVEQLSSLATATHTNVARSLIVALTLIGKLDLDAAKQIAREKLKS